MQASSNPNVIHTDDAFAKVLTSRNRPAGMIRFSLQAGTDDVREHRRALLAEDRVREDQIVPGLANMPQRGTLRGQTMGLC